jgi:hypothetical protein
MDDAEHLRMRGLLRTAAGVVAIGLLCFSCGKPAGRVEITETRDVTASPAKQESQGSFTWTAPEGWTQAPATAMRIANFTIGADGQTECYVTVLKGSGGGAEMNINRWRAQMGMESEPLNAEAIEKLPKISMLGKQVPLAEVAGAYQGMSGEPKSGYILMGTICELANESVFIKMIGPESTVRAERERFIAFCGSIK